MPGRSKDNIYEVTMCSMQGVIKRSQEEFMYFLMKYSTFIDFDEVDMRNYLPEKSNNHRGRNIYCIVFMLECI